MRINTHNVRGRGGLGGGNNVMVFDTKGLCDIVVYDVSGSYDIAVCVMLQFLTSGTGFGHVCGPNQYQLM